MIGRIFKTVFFLLAAVGAILFAAKYYIANDSGTITAVHPLRGHAVQAVYATGTVEPSVMLPIAPRNPGRLVTLLADEGDQVEKGQAMAQLEDDDLQRTIDELRARTDLTKKEYARKAALAKAGAVPREAVDKARADLDMAVAASSRAEVALSYMKLTAPELGLVIRRDGEVGELIQAGQPVFWLACCDGLRIEAEVDEEDISLVAPQQGVVIRADAFPGEVFRGTVQSVTPKGDPVSRSYRVRISLPTDTKLMIGMTAETNIIITEKKDALLVPSSAVKNGAVWLIRNNRAVLKKVKTGVHADHAVEITEGLDETGRIMLDASQPMAEGKPVKAAVQDWAP